MVGVAKCWFPFPPRPPFKMQYSWQSPDMSAMTLPLAASLMTVPSGTLIRRSSPFFPDMFFFFPSSPFSAAYFLVCRKSSRVLAPLSTTKKTLPPSPPSPPSGPPLGTNFSLRNETCPSPPFPLCTVILALSTNICLLRCSKKTAPGRTCLPGTLVVKRLDYCSSTG